MKPGTGAEPALAARRLEVDAVVHHLRCQERLDLAGEENAPITAFGDEEGLDAEPIADDDESALVRVPEGEGKHPVEAFDGIDSRFPIEGQDYFGVRAGLKAMASRHQLRSEGFEAVNLPVENQL